MIIDTIKGLFIYKEIDRLIIKDEIHQNNLERVFYLGIVSAPVILTLVLTYYNALHIGSSIDYAWRLGIIRIHSTFFVILIGGSVLTYKLKKAKSSGLTSRIIVDFTFFIITMAGVGSALVDQMVTPSIVPYMLGCTVTALVILVRPALAFLYFFISYVIIYTALPFFQPNEAILLSNRLAGLVAAAIGLMLSLIMWKNNIIRYRQSRLIESQKKEIENNYERLVKYANDLDRANSAKAKFFSIIAHDLRGPITSTIIASEILLDADDYTPEQKTNLVRLLHEKLKRTYKLLENLLTWSKSQVNQIIYTPIDLNLYSIVEENIELLNIIAIEKSITLINRISPDFMVFADKEMSNTIFRNLVSNAIKFTDVNGTVEIDAKIYWNNGEKDCLEISVRDTGVGMTQEMVENLFQIDKKVFTLGTKNETGSGLGLILCKDFIEKQGGTIRVTSEVGKGSCFMFTLPLYKEIRVTEMSS